MATRKVTVWSTKNSQLKHYETEAQTWGDLRTLIQEDYDLGNLKATESVNKTTLEHIDAALPEGEFRLFLRPKETKSGVDFDGMSFKDLRDFIKENPEVRDCLNSFVPGKNFTQLSTDSLRAGLKNCFTSEAIPTPVSGEIVEESQEVSQMTFVQRLEKIEQDFMQLDRGLEDEDTDFYEDELEYDFSIIRESLATLLDSLKKNAPVNHVEEGEVADLQAEMRDLMEGFLN